MSSSLSISNSKEEDPTSTCHEKFRRNSLSKQQSCSSSSNKGILLSRLPANLRASVVEFDDNNDGIIGADELIMVIDNLQKTRWHNNMLRNLVYGLGLFALLLIACIFGASISAARLSKDTNVDPITGIAYVKDGSSGGNNNHHGAVLKTEDVVIYTDNMDFVGMSNDELKVLKQIILDSGNVKFEVKGYGRSNDGLHIHLIVEGGSIITWDSDGIVNATGLAEVILDSAFPTVRSSDDSDTGSETEEEEQEEEGQRHRRRWLSGGCGENGESGGGSTNVSRG